MKKNAKEFLQEMKEWHSDFYETSLELIKDVELAVNSTAALSEQQRGFLCGKLRKIHRLWLEKFITVNSIEFEIMSFEIATYINSCS